MAVQPYGIPTPSYGIPTPPYPQSPGTAACVPPQVGNISIPMPRDVIKQKLFEEFRKAIYKEISDIMYATRQSAINGNWDVATFMRELENLFRIKAQ